MKYDTSQTWCVAVQFYREENMNESTFIPHKRIDIMIPIFLVEMYDSAEKKDEFSRNKCLFGNNFITH